MLLLVGWRGVGGAVSHRMGRWVLGPMRGSARGGWYCWLISMMIWSRVVCWYVSNTTTCVR